MSFTKDPFVKMQPAAIKIAWVMSLCFVGIPICLENEPFKNRLSFL